MGTLTRFRLFATCSMVASVIVLAARFGPAAGNPLRVGFQILLILASALVLTWILSAAIEWHIHRLSRFADSVLASSRPDALLAGNIDEIAVLDASFRRMAERIRDLVDRLSLESSRRDVILKSLVEGVLAVDHQMRILFCNQALASIVGLQHPVPENTPLVGLIRDPQLLSLVAGVISTGDPVRARLQFASGEASVFEAHAAALEVPPHRGAVVVLHDITGLERLERVRRDFVANVSHELRTPLTAIRGYAETLLAGALEDQANNRRFVEVIEAHAIRLNNIASDLLALTDLESGRREPTPGPVSVADAINTAILTVEPEAALRDVHLLRGPVPELFVTGHTIRLEQVLVNLLSNAVKFNSTGGEARIEAGLDAEGRVAITVSDTGSGIPSADLPRIFERFYRVDRARSREVGGTGLGLSIVKHVVDRMDGAIKVESRLGKGSTFTVLLPQRAGSLAA